MKDRFLYELHFHTKESSPCAVTPAAEMVRAYKKRGYTGVIVTDHFVNCNRYFHTEQPWEEKIERYLQGFREAKAEGDKIGLDVFFGWEYTFRETMDDFVTFGVAPEFLLRHPELCSLPLAEYTALVRSYGGMVWHAHPFRRAPWLGDKKIFPRAFPEVDGMEILSGRMNHEEANRQALCWAEEHALPGFAGSDAHDTDDISAGVLLSRRAESTEDLVSLLKAGGFSFYCSRYDVTDFDAYFVKKV